MKLHAIFWQLRGNNCNTRNYTAGKKCWMSQHSALIRNYNVKSINNAGGFAGSGHKWRMYNKLCILCTGRNKIRHTEREKNLCYCLVYVASEFNVLYFKSTYYLILWNTEHSPFWHAQLVNKHSAFHETQKFIAHKSWPLFLTLSRIKSVHTLPFHFYKICFNVIHPTNLTSTPKFSPSCLTTKTLNKAA